MSASDNAFIKAYADELAIAVGRPARNTSRGPLAPHEPPMRLDRTAHAWESRVSLSGLYTRQPAAPAATVDATVDASARIDPLQQSSHSQTPATTHASIALESTLSPLAVETIYVGFVQPVSNPRAYEAAHAESSSADPTKPTARDHAASLRLDDKTPVLLPYPHLHLWKQGEEAPPATESAVTSAPSSGPELLEVDSAITPRPASLDPFRAQWEVDQFRWPDRIAMLREHCNAALDQLIGTLVSQHRLTGNVVAITSCERGEGRTLFALLLAQRAAGAGYTVALVDGDLEHPELAQQLGVTHSRGWMEGEATREHLEEVAIQSVDDGITVLPLREASGHVDDRLDDRGHEGSRRAMLRLLAEKYRLVLLDTGPMLTAARRWFGAFAHETLDAALVVRDVQSTSFSHLDHVVDRIRATGIGFVGIVENFVPPETD